MLPTFYNVRVSTTETIQLVDELVKARIPKPTATRLVDRIDRGNLEPDNPKWINLENDVQDLKNDVQDLKNDVGILQKDVGFVKNDIHWLKWAIALGFSALIALMFGIVGIVTYLHNDMKAEIHSVRTEMQSMQKETNAKIDQLNAKIDQILLQRR